MTGVLADGLRQKSSDSRTKYETDAPRSGDKRHPFRLIRIVRNVGDSRLANAQDPLHVNDIINT